MPASTPIRRRHGPDLHRHERHAAARMRRPRGVCDQYAASGSAGRATRSGPLVINLAGQRQRRLEQRDDRDDRHAQQQPGQPVLRHNDLLRRRRSGHLHRRSTPTATTCSTAAGAPAALANNDPVYLGATMRTRSRPFLHGFIKIERRTGPTTWDDVTMEILNLGFSGRNQDGAICADPTPNAVIRLQRLRDNGLPPALRARGEQLQRLALRHDFWPQRALRRPRGQHAPAADQRPA